MKNVENLEVIILSSGVLIHNIVKTKPDNTVAITPVLEYRFQKNVIKIAGDNVPPTPAHAQLTTKYTSDCEVRAMTTPMIPEIRITILESETNCLSVSLTPSVRWIISSLTELVTTIICEFAVVIIAA